jgi:hypothetical protein
MELYYDRCSGWPGIMCPVMLCAPCRSSSVVSLSDWAKRTLKLGRFRSLRRSPRMNKGEAT